MDLKWRQIKAIFGAFYIVKLLQKSKTKCFLVEKMLLVKNRKKIIIKKGNEFSKKKEADAYFPQNNEN